MVAERTWVTIVAVSCHRGILTSAGLGAGVVCAGILIVALDRVSRAEAVDTVVSHGTGIGVITATRVQDIVHAAPFSRAAIIGAIIAIVAKIDEITADEGRFIRVPVTVIIQPVAGFLGWHRCVASRESLGRTGPGTATRAKVILNLTGRGQAQRY